MSEEQKAPESGEQKRAKAKNYKDLLVWQKGMELTRQVYGVPQTFPGEEKFGLVSHMCRAIVHRLYYRGVGRSHDQDHRSTFRWVDAPSGRTA